MTPDINDKLTLPALGTMTSLAGAGLTAGVSTSIDCADLSAWQAAGAQTAVHFAIDAFDPVTGKRVPGTYNEYKAVVSGDSLGDITYQGGDAEQDYPAGENTRVYMLITAAWGIDLIEHLLVSHNQNGTLKTGAISNSNMFGTGVVNAAAIGPGAATASKLESDATGHGFLEIGRHTLGVAGNALTVSDLPARKYLKIVIYAFNTGGTIDTYVRFNNDASANYARRHSGNGAGESTFGGGTTLITFGSGNYPSFTLIEITNVAAQEKMASFQNAQQNTAGAANIPGRAEGVAKWANAADLISRIDVVNPGTGNYAAGSELIVLGHN